MYFGVDISAVQGGDVDFQWLKNNGYSFVICRNFVGNDFKDPNIEHFLSGAKAAGLYTGVYNFAYILPTDPAHPNRDPESQATLHFQNTPQDELVFLDVEWPAPGPDWIKWNVNAAFIDDWVYRYCQKYFELSGKKVIIYTYPNFAKSVNFRNEIGQYLLWYADYSNLPIVSPWSDWVMMQTSGGTKLVLPNGKPTDVDVVKDLTLWGVDLVNHPTPTVPPQIKITVNPSPPSTSNSSTAVNTQPTSNGTSVNKIMEIIQPFVQPLGAVVLQILKVLLHIKG